jgi:UDPglucose 6-dehydrogenase
MTQARIAVFGAGYAGLVTGACFAELGHDVVVRDVSTERIDALREGRLPIYEPGLADVIERNAERLMFTLDAGDTADAEALFVCVGTPATYAGDADLSAVWTVIDDLPPLSAGAVLVMKSTVPVGTGDKVRAGLDARRLEHVGYVSNPEFLSEGTAVRDFLEPDRVVIGAFDQADGDVVEALHAGIDAPVVRTDVASAEMIKLASNAFLATRISFINEIANVCEATGADVEEVARGMGLDRRIGTRYLHAGVGYGGSCLLGDETVLARREGRTRLLSLARLFEEVGDGNRVDILSWRPDGSGAEFLPLRAVTRRAYEGDVVELQTKMGRRLRCTSDHPFVTNSGVKLAGELTTDDWLPVAQGAPPAARRRPRLLNVVGELGRATLTPRDVIVRPHRDELAAVGVRGLQSATAVLDHPRGHVTRSHDIVRSGALRLHETVELDLDLSEAFFGTARNGTYVPAMIRADSAFWRVVGLYIAEGHCSRDGQRDRLQWSFHPSDEEKRVAEVAAFWRERGVKATVRGLSTTRAVSVSSRLLAEWWCGELGLGRNCYEQRLPDLIWDEAPEHKRALLSGLWHGDGSWSYINRGPSVVLEYGTVSRELADGILRLLGDLGIVARLKVRPKTPRTAETYFLVISGADQIEGVLDLVPDEDRARIRESIALQAKRIAPTGFRKRDNAAWARVVDVRTQRFVGEVYSVEVEPTHTFVTTGGLVTHNCYPKDVSFLKLLAGNSGYHFQLVNAVIEVNELQKRRVIQKLQKHLGSLRGKTIALLGLTFKPNTDDLREAPSLVIASRLLAEGADVRGWDPVADARGILKGVTISETALEALRDADAAVIVTEWSELRELPLDQVRSAMRQPLIIDGRNTLDPAQVRAAGIAYEGIGRPVSPFADLPETEERPAEDRELQP